MDNIFVVGIAGGSGSGKSTFTEKLETLFADKCLTLSCDNYYYGHDDLSMEQRNNLNYDAPEAVEFSLFVEQLKQLKDNKSICCPIYDFSQHTRSKETILIEPKPIILLDGILLYNNEELRNLIDLKIYVDSDADERILRRIARDTVLRGRSVQSIMEQYIKTVKPMHNLYVEPTKIYADIIINGGMNENALNLVKTKIEAILNESER